MDMHFDDIPAFIGADSEMPSFFDESDDFMPSGNLSPEKTQCDLFPPGELKAATQSSSMFIEEFNWDLNCEGATDCPSGQPDEASEFSIQNWPEDNAEPNTDAAIAHKGNPITQGTTSIDEFFIKNGARRPPFPCNYCQSRRLQCLILQTTAANPNPTTSCSSCVALFRECSLSGYAKRIPLSFETSEPVIGQLHGVNEQDGSLEQFEGHVSPLASKSSISALSSKRVQTRSVRKTRSLRNWLSNHLDNPYPTEEEKDVLANDSSLSRSQVDNWFGNARRRQRMTSRMLNNPSSKVFVSGSPMPQAFGMSPMERWRKSPPKEEPASASAIQSALSTHSSSQGSLGSLENDWLEDFDGSTDSSCLFNHDYNSTDASSESAASANSQRSAYANSVAGLFAIDSPEDRKQQYGVRPSRRKSARSRAFQCTFCRRSYKKKYDWVRHERSIHLPGLDSYVCSIPLLPDQSYLVWRIDECNPRCIFCGHTSPKNEHFKSHEFETCTERPVEERRFTRKDHLWQHLRKFHGCQKWDGWAVDISLLRQRLDPLHSCCGFCGELLRGWEERMDHIAAHFKTGLTMDSWTGGSGISIEYPQDGSPDV